ncbi:MAG: extracellular solute-binding protein, partial [Geminicoccaceae bacterium]
MGIFSGLTRRRMLKGSATSAALMAGGGFPLLSKRARAELALEPFKAPGGKMFNSDLTYFQDGNWLHAPLWLSPHFKEAAGVGIASRELYSGGDTVAKVLPQLLSNRPRFDFVQFPSLFFGSFAETGMLEPLDDYFAQYDDANDYLFFFIPAYCEFYTKWNGQRYGVMLDGDIHILHYRKQYFNNPELQAKFSQRFQRELEEPKTWPHFLDAVQFFTEELSGDGIYGTSMVVNPPNFGWG